MYMKIGIIGIGELGSSLLKGLINSGVNTAELVIYDKNANKTAAYSRTGICIAKDAGEVVEDSTIIMLAVKPVDYGAVLSEIENKLDNAKIIISFMAGVSLNELNSLAKARLFRAMPNITCAQNESPILLSSRSGQDPKQAIDVLSKLGKVVIINEQLMDGLTVLIGSGPALIANIMESFYRFGVMKGLTPTDSKLLVNQLFLGTSKLALEIPYGDILEKISTPGGITARALFEMEKRGIGGSIMDSMDSTSNKR